MKTQDIYIGNCSKNGIYHYEFKNGELRKEFFTKDFARCTYLCTSRKNLYSVVELQKTDKETQGYVLAYKKENKRLKNIDKKISYGQGPCHIEINEKMKMLYVSNYIDGYLTIFKLNKDGTIGNKIYSHIENKEKSHLHCVKALMKQGFFFVVDLGANVLIAYEIINEDIKEISRIQFEQGTEPRHIAINKDKIYIISEKSCKIYIIKFKEKELNIIGEVSILPNDIKKQENYTGCAIKISKDLKFLYASIREHNSISIYKIKKDNLEMIQNISCEGKIPRDLELDKTGKYLLVANQDSNDVAIFKRNKRTGKIAYIRKKVMESPTCIIVE